MCVCVNIFDLISRTDSSGNCVSNEEGRAFTTIANAIVKMMVSCANIFNQTVEMEIKLLLLFHLVCFFFFSKVKSRTRSTENEGEIIK